MFKPNSLASKIDYTYLVPAGTYKEFNEFLLKASKYSFRSLCVPPSLIPYIRDNFKNLNFKISSVAGFPLGFTLTETKLAEIEYLLELGVDEIDFVINLIWLKSKDYKKLEKELFSIRKIAENKVLKGIIETSYLQEADIKNAVEIFIFTGINFIKTSTGFAKRGASVEDIEIIKKFSKGRIKIKASGGIKTLRDTLSFLFAGADVIGTSSGYEIVKEMETQGKITSNLEEIELYVDGSSLGNPGPGGWAVLIKSGEKEEILSGGEPLATNNQMELKAVISALSHFKEPKILKIYTDSEYVIKGVTEWLPKWKKRGYITSDGKPVKNRELWEVLERLINFHQVKWEKVSAHSGNFYNEKVDKIAKESAKKWRKNF
ncbi:MAG: Ribonuclease HI [Thermodesulfobacterium sp.]|uniref:Multifunctional fusion protein n=1 Tax=Candidatus Thermodesulfobacterium syntrophicum TaxID=3060442 RepID=A0AAE3P5C5_9BACT|nr:Ribonuclease HI [Candidatus Thermodesulfobacterium syntrophicum]